MDPFELSFEETERMEGRNLSNVKGDPGKETYAGISRVYWKSWMGWPIIDRYKKDGKVPLAIQKELLPHVRKFYKVNFWDRFQGDEVALVSLPVAKELFDTSVNMGVTRAVEFFQTALNMLNQYGKTYPDIKVDGQLGSITIKTLGRSIVSRPGSDELNESILLNCMNGEQYIHYKNNPLHEGFRGWFRRV